VRDVLWFSVAYPVSLLLAVALSYEVAEVRYRRRGFLAWRYVRNKACVLRRG